MQATEEVRIHVYLAQSGVASRRQIERWITEGKVSVNGKPAKLGQKIIPTKDALKVKGKLIHAVAVKPTVLAFYKPAGVVTTLKDPEGRKTVADFLPKKVRLFPVGRLDLNSEGLVLLTNDGDLAYRLTHPKFEVPKVYEVKIRGELDDSRIDYIRKGVETIDGKLSGAKVLGFYDVTREGFPKTLVRIQIHEGQYHHIKRMFEALKCRVIKLKRVSVAGVSCKGLGKGEYRYLTAQQIKELRKAAEGSE